MEESIPIKMVRDESGGCNEARVTQAVSTKVSDAVYYGDGTWDKIPYTIEVFSSVSLVCDQSESQVYKAQEIAHQLAFESAHRRLPNVLVGHVQNIKELYNGYFNG